MGNIYIYIYIKFIIDIYVFIINWYYNHGTMIISGCVTLWLLQKIISLALDVPMFRGDTSWLFFDESKDIIDIWIM